MNEFDSLLKVCAELAWEYEGELVFIGGVALALHAMNSPTASAFVEDTYDGDFYISLLGLTELRDMHELISIRRSGRYSFTRSGFDFDVFSEYSLGLPVPYEPVQAEAVEYGGVLVANIEHLFALKLGAMQARLHAEKRQKDVRDLFRLALVDHEFRPDMAAPYLQDEHLEALDRAIKSDAILEMVGGNAQQAKAVRTRLRSIQQEILRAMGEPTQTPRSPKCRQ